MSDQPKSSHDLNALAIAHLREVVSYHAKKCALCEQILKESTV